MKIKKIIPTLLAGAMMMSVVGCGNSDNSSESSDSGKVTLTLGMTADPFEAEIVEEQVAAFMEANEDIEVVVEPIAGDIWEVLKTRMVAGDEPDVFYMDIFQTPQFIDAGQLAAIDDVLTEEDMADFDSALLNAFKGEDGTLYGVPKDYSTLGLYYNKQMFEDAGLEPPTTWEELEAAAKALTKDNVTGLSLQNELPRVQPFFYSNGGTMMEDGVPTLNNEKNIEAYEFWLSLLENDYAKTPQELGVGWDGDAFASEMVAMTVEGTWMENSLIELNPDLEYGVVPVPVAETEASMQFTVAYSMSTNTESPEEAKELIKFLTSTEQQLVVADAGRAIPSRTSAVETYVEKYPERQVFVDMVSVASEFRYGIVSSTVVDEAAKAMEKVLLDPDASVQDAFDEAQANIEKALEDY